MRLRLCIEPVPISTWGISLANKLPKEEWDEIRRKVYRDAGNRCEVCGESNITLHAHEKWKFDDKKGVQRLVGFECCCEICHNVHHFGRSEETMGPSQIKKLIEHWCLVNGKTKKDFLVYRQVVFERSKRRANRQYIVKVGRRILV